MKMLLFCIFVFVKTLISLSFQISEDTFQNNPLAEGEVPTRMMNGLLVPDSNLGEKIFQANVEQPQLS